MKSNSIKKVVFLGALSIIGIIAFQAFWVMRTWNLKEQEFDEQVTMTLQRVAKNFEQLGTQVPSFDLINQVSSNYYVVNVNNEINANTLQYFLQKELEAAGLTEDFEYGIYDCGTNKMVYGNYVSYNNETLRAEEKEQLPIYDKFTYYFGVRFPQRTSHILSNMGVTIIFSGILLLTILFFMYTLSIILKQKRLSEMQKDFINNMTHEFKTPISTIKISANTLLRNDTVGNDERLRRYATIIEEQNQRLNNQVEKVLQIAKIEQDNFKLKRESVDLHDVLEGVLRSNQMRVEAEGGSLTTNLRAKQTAISADPLHLTNILHNLLDNAIKYCRQRPIIEVTTEQVGDEIHLTVRDEGIGIAADQQAKVFDKFFRVSTGNVHNVKGFGLGLFYLKNICNSHGWQVKLESTPEVGTKITIIIPQKQAKSIDGRRLFPRAAFN